MTVNDRAAVIELLGRRRPVETVSATKPKIGTAISHRFPRGVTAIVVEQNGRVAGIAVVRQKFLLGDYLELLGVADWARGKGLGGQLLTHVEEAVFARGKNVFACVSDFNDQARKFYKKQGYQEIGPMPDFLIPGSAEISAAEDQRAGKGENSIAISHQLSAIRP